MAFSFSPKIVTDGLVLALDAANTRSYISGSTSWNDISRGGNNGTLVNGPTYDSANGGCIIFDGVDDYNLAPNNSSLQPPISLTLECTLNPSSIVNGSWMIAYTGADSGAFVQYGFRVAATNRLSGYIKSSGSIAQTFGDTLSVGTWIHGTLTYDGTSANLYCNGILRAITAISGAMDYNAYGSPYFLTIGRKNSIDGQYFNGKFAAARVYNRALSAIEILQNYNATKRRFGL